MKYSIITITYNGLEHTIKCLNSLYQYTKDFELIIVDNASTDGTQGYLKEMLARKDNLKVIFNNENRSFSVANNQGIKMAEGEYIVILNNDTILTPNWLERLQDCMDNASYKNIGMVGPVSNSSAGRQQVGMQNPEEWYLKYRGVWFLAGRLFGWCVLLKRSILNEIGLFDEQFINSFEDNDLCLRAQLAGYKLVIAYDTYIYHTGQATFQSIMDLKKYQENGELNQKRFYDKWYNPTKKKLVAVYRIANCEKYIRQSLEQTSKFADSIIVHLCRSKDRTEEIVKEFPKVIKIQKYDGPFQEDYERNWLLQEALKLYEEDKADWCISVDGDEVYEDRFIEQVQAMMNPRNPEIFGYWCQWKTIWKKKDGIEYFRADSTFGQFSNYRFFKLIKGQEITSQHPEGHHSGSAPLIPTENLRWSKIRVKHLGYDTPEQRQKKYEFYRDNDHFPDARDIGNKDYTHLIDEDVVLKKYDPNNSISLVMIIKNEEENIKGCLEHIASIIDEFIIVDTGSTDKTKEIIQEFASSSPAPVKLLDFEWCDNFALARNYAKSFATSKWFLHLDADERFENKDIPVLLRMTEEDCDAFVFHVINYLEKPLAGQPPKYASSDSMRLFRNLSELYYTGIVHETLDDSIAAKRRRNGVELMKTKVVLHHLGYLKKKEKLIFKFMHYERFNERQIEITEGKDPRPFCSLGLHYLQDGNQHKALEYFQKAIALDPYYWHANTQMAALNLNAAKHFLKNSMVSLPDGHPIKEQAKVILEFLGKYHFGHIKIDLVEEEKCQLPVAN